MGSLATWTLLSRHETCFPAWRYFCYCILCTLVRTRGGCRHRRVPGCVGHPLSHLIVAHVIAHHHHEDEMSLLAEVLVSPMYLVDQIDSTSAMMLHIASHVTNRHVVRQYLQDMHTHRVRAFESGSFIVDASSPVRACLSLVCQVHTSWTAVPHMTIQYKNALDEIIKREDTK